MSKDVDAILDRGVSWEVDTALRARRSERRAWLTVWILAVLLFTAIAAVALLTPLKEIQTVILRVNDTTGVVDTVVTNQPVVAGTNEVLDKYWLSQYVNAREEYSLALVYDNYQKVRLMSTAPIGKAVYEYVRPENPRSPIKVIGQGTIEARITSISFLAHNVGVVRFERTQRDAGGDGRTTRHIATITFDYLAPPLDEADRRINPIGFQVSDYRIDDEAVVSGSVR
jgi:type IV secretion system protein VirB8